MPRPTRNLGGVGSYNGKPSSTSHDKSQKTREYSKDSFVLGALRLSLTKSDVVGRMIHPHELIDKGNYHNGRDKYLKKRI